MIFFGSVDPKLRYPDLSNITVIQEECPVNMPGCYHSVVGVRGVDCIINKETPPCAHYSTESVLKKLNAIL
jgi:hypothetical protein